MNEFNSTAFRNVCGTFATGVTIITSKNNGKIHGMTANGFLSVSLDPPLILVSVGNDKKMCETIKQSGHYGVSILADHQLEISNHFAGRKNEQLAVEFEEINGIQVIKNSISQIVAKVTSAHLEGDHTLFIGKVLNFTISEYQKSLLFYKGKYRDLLL